MMKSYYQYDLYFNTTFDTKFNTTFPSASHTSPSCDTVTRTTLGAAVTIMTTVFNGCTSNNGFDLYFNTVVATIVAVASVFLQL